MATETTFWGFIHLNIHQVESIKNYMGDKKYGNKMIDKQSFLSESRGYTLAFGRVVRGGFEERIFWFNELESFLKNVVALYCTVCFEFEDKQGLFVYDYIYDIEKKGWRIYEDHFIRQDADGGFLNSI